MIVLILLIIVFLNISDLKKLNILLVCLEIVKSISIRKMFIFITEMNGKRTSGDKFIKMMLDLNCYIDMDEE